MNAGLDFARMRSHHDSFAPRRNDHAVASRRAAFFAIFPFFASPDASRVPKVPRNGVVSIRDRVSSQNSIEECRSGLSK